MPPTVRLSVFPAGRLRGGPEEGPGRLLFRVRSCVPVLRLDVARRRGQLAVAAYAEVAGQDLRMRTVSFLGLTAQRAEGRHPLAEALELGEQLAAELRAAR